MTTLIFTNIEKNIVLRLHSDIVSELLTDRIRIWKSGDNVNSRSDDTIGLIVLDLQSQTIRCQNYTQNFILFTTVKNLKIARQNPQIPSWPPNSQDIGKNPNPKQWERCTLVTSCEECHYNVQDCVRAGALDPTHMDCYRSYRVGQRTRTRNF